MALQKSKISERSGATLAYHDVLNVQFGVDTVSVVLASYVDAAAKVAKKNFVEVKPYSFSYDGSAIVVSAKAFAQAKLLTLPEFAGATEVA